MLKKNKIFLTILSALVLVGAVSGAYWYLSRDSRLYDQIKSQPGLVSLWNRAQTVNEKLSKDPAEASYYMELGLIWKGLGEQSGIKTFLRRSLATYEAGIKRFGQKNILFYLNAGNLAEQLGDFIKAERYFKKAIEISSADESGYIELADLYSYKMKKNKSEVVAVYESGMRMMVSPVPLIYARGSYLRRIGDYKNALVDYEILSQNFPDHLGYKEIVKELEALIGNNP